MRLKDYDDDDGKRVWLSDEELKQLIEQAETPHQRLAFLLAGRVGLRRSEIIEVTPQDLVSGPTGEHIRVWESYAKRDKYREPPVPKEVVTIAETLAYQQDDDEPLLDVAGSTVYRWVKRAAAQLEEETGDEGWQYLDVHDLRRTWGTYLLEQGVIPSVVMAFGGWEDWETFRKHYLGEFSPEAIRRERGKVDFLEGGDESADVVHPGTMEQSTSRDLAN